MFSLHAHSGDGNFAQFCKIINIDIRKLPKKFQIYISKIDNFTDQSVNCRSAKYRTGCKVQTRSWKVTKFGEWCYVIYI